MNTKTHWDEIYASKKAMEVSWYQAHPQQSLDLIRRACGSKTAQIIDVGGGASTLVDHLIDDDFANVTVLDISASALADAKSRLGDNARKVTWIEVDVTTADLPAQHFDIWHDRAVFHFLINAGDRQRYVGVMSQALRQGGHAIVATFAWDGPTQCSGLEVARYSLEKLQAEFGDGFSLLKSCRELHHTPFGTQQPFIYCVFGRL